MLARRRSVNDKRQFGIKTDRTSKGNNEAANGENDAWLVTQSRQTLGSRIYEMIRWLHPRRLMVLLAAAVGLIKRIAMVAVYGRRCRRARLLTWFSEQLRRGGGCAAAQLASLEPCDLRMVWREGALLCALVNALAPGACPDHPDNNLALAQEAVKRQWALPPAFTDDELLQVTFSSHFERRLLRYLSAIQQASERLPGVPEGATPDVTGRPGGLDASGAQASPACVARGMGLFTATQFRRATFHLYLLDADPSDVFVVIQTQRDFGFARVGHHGCVLPNRYSNIPITISQDTGNGTRVTFTPQSYGPHELVILRKGAHIPGSPFSIPVEKTTNFESVDKEDVHTPVRRKRLRVLLRTVDFVTEKMILTEDGKLKKIPQKFLEEHLTAIKEGKRRRKPEIYIYVSEEGSTMHQVWGSSPGCSDAESEQEGEWSVARYSPARRVSGSSHDPRHDGLGKGKCLQRQSNLDSVLKKPKVFHDTKSRLVKGTEFHSRCKKIISMCKFVLDKSRKSHGLNLLNAVHKIVDGRPIRMSDEIELMLQQLTEAVQPKGLEPILSSKPDARETTEDKEEPVSATDQMISPSLAGGEGCSNPSNVAVHTQIKCFEDRLAYCNNYIESVLQQNNATPVSSDGSISTSALESPQRDNNTDGYTSGQLGSLIQKEPFATELAQQPTTDLFNSQIELLDNVSSPPKSDIDAPTDSLKVKTTTPGKVESGELSPTSGHNLAGFWPASSSSPSSMSEASTEAAAAIFPDLDAFLSGQFTKYMASETQFHLWPSDIAFGDVHDTISAMDYDEMVDFDSVISAPNLEEALVKLEHGLRMKSSTKRKCEGKFQYDAKAGTCGNGEYAGIKTQSGDWEVSDNEETPLTSIDKPETDQNEDNELGSCQAEEHLEQDCHQNRSPDIVQLVVNPPDQEDDPGDGFGADDLDEVDSNPSPQAGHPSVDGWDSAYLSIDDLKGSPENRLASNSVSTCSLRNASHEKERPCWSEDGNTAITGFMGPAEKEIWGFDEQQDDDDEPVSGLPYYPRVLTPLTKMMSLILEEDEEKLVTCAIGDERDVADKSLLETRQSDPDLLGVCNLDVQSNESKTDLQNTNDSETFPVSSPDLDQDFEEIPSDNLDDNIKDTLNNPINQNFEDTSNKHVDNNLDDNFDELYLQNLDSELDEVLDDALDEDVSVAFDALIAEQLDLFEQGSDFDSALAEALQVSALQDQIELPSQERLALPIQNNLELVMENNIELPSQLDSIELSVKNEETSFPVRYEINDFPIQLESTEMPVQEECTELLVNQSTEMSKLQENTKFPLQHNILELEMQQESGDLPLQKCLELLDKHERVCDSKVQHEATEFLVQHADTEMPALEEHTEPPVYQEKAEFLTHYVNTELLTCEESTDFPVQNENTEFLLLQEEFPVDEGNEEFLVHQECIQYPECLERTEFSGQCESSTELPIHQDSAIKFPIQEESSKFQKWQGSTDLLMQSNGTELTTLELSVLKESMDCDITEGNKLNELNCCSRRIPDTCLREKEDEESDGSNLVACSQAVALAIEVEAICKDAITIKNECISDNALTTEKNFLENPCKYYENTRESEILEKAAESETLIADNTEEMFDQPEEERKKSTEQFKVTTDYVLSEKVDEKTSPINHGPVAKVNECFTTKEYVSFKKEYWDRKVQMLDLVGRHSQPRSAEGNNNSVKKLTIHNQSDGCNSSLPSAEDRPTFATGQLENRERLLRSPSLYRARRVLVSEELDDGNIHECQISEDYRRDQQVDKASREECVITTDLRRYKEAEDTKTECLRGDTKQCTEAEVVQEKCSSKSLNSSSGEYTPRRSRLRKILESAEKNSRELDDIVEGLHADKRYRRDSSARKDNPEEMKARFQTAKQFFQSLEKNNSKLRRGLSSEGEDGSHWETVTAGWRGPLGGSERVRVPRRSRLKDLF